MKITICGGGNIGTQIAVHCAEIGHEVTIFTSKPEKFKKHLVIVNENGKIIHEGDILRATYDNEIAFGESDLIFVTLPAMFIKGIAEKIYPYIRKNVKICIVPGTGGGECYFKKCIEKGAIVMGLQRVPSVARLIEYGSLVRCTGYREELFVASLPCKYVDECCQIIKNIFKMKCSSLPNYLNLTLTPSNPILHTVRLKQIFLNYKDGIVYKKLPLFYEDWDNETSELLFKCDEEVQEICKRLSNKFNLSYVKSLKEHYESDNVENMTKKISSITAFKGLKTPSIVISDSKLIPDLNSRYFTSDFSFGLTIIVQIANFIGLDVLNCKAILEWYNSIKINDSEFKFKDCNINNLEQLINYYSI